MAPEVLNNKGYTYKADVYSFGIVLYEIITRTTPYKGLNAMQIAMAVVNEDKRPDMTQIPGDCPPGLVKVMEDCWKKDPEERPSFPEITKALREIEI